MAKRNSVIPKDHPHRNAYQELSGFIYQDLKKAVIERGMDFELVVSSSHGTLQDYFIHHYDEPRIPKRLEEFDEWMDRTLGARGHKPDDPIRQFKQFTQKEEEPEPKPIRVKIEKPKKPKREKNKEFGVFGGTKKEYTYNLSKDLLSKKGNYSNKELVKKFGDQLFEKVQNKFPEANDKSVKIWFKRSLDKFRP